MLVWNRKSSCHSKVARQLREAVNADLNGKGGLSILEMEAAGSSYMPVPIHHTAADQVRTNLPSSNPVTCPLSPCYYFQNNTGQKHTTASRGHVVRIPNALLPYWLCVSSVSPAACWDSTLKAFTSHF